MRAFECIDNNRKAKTTHKATHKHTGQPTCSQMLRSVTILSLLAHAKANATKLIGHIFGLCAVDCCELCSLFIEQIVESIGSKLYRIC